MTNLDQHTIDKLFRDLIRVYSTSVTSIIGLDSVKTAIDELVCGDGKLMEEIKKLSNCIKNTQPRMFPLDNLMLIFDKEVQSLFDKNQVNKQSLFQLLDQFKLRLESDLDKLVKQGIEFINDEDFIVIHSIEENIEYLIPEAKKNGKKNKILLLKQDLLTTGEILKILTQKEIEFEVIPEYDLVHYMDKITKLFIGTQALTSDNKLVCDPGTSNIVSECHIYKIPIFLFLKTLKFSHYPASDQNIRKNTYQDVLDGIEYNYSIHSNDIVSLDLVNHIITEKGEISHGQVAEIRETIITA